MYLVRAASSDDEQACACVRKCAPSTTYFPLRPSSPTHPGLHLNPKMKRYTCPGSWEQQNRLIWLASEGRGWARVVASQVAVADLESDQSCTRQRWHHWLAIGQWADRCRSIQNTKAAWRKPVYVYFALTVRCVRQKRRKEGTRTTAWQRQDKIGRRGTRGVLVLVLVLMLVLVLRRALQRALMQGPHLEVGHEQEGRVT